MGTIQIKVHQALAKALKRLGADTMFGLIGDANLYMADAFARECGGRYVAAANEAGAVLMALGYAQVSGRTGVATVTHGPGLTNSLTALIEGVKNSVPVVLLVGDTPIEDRDHQQKALQREFITATGAGFEQLRSAATVSDDVARAFRRAALERRPVALNMPSDLQWLDAEDRAFELYLPDARRGVIEGPEMDKAIGIIASARRPVVLGGRGAFDHEAEAAIIRLADRMEAPLSTTLLGKGLFASHPFNLGVFGTLSNAVAAEAIAESDCVIAFGASLNRFTTDSNRLLKGKRVIHVSHEREHVGRYLTPDAGLVGDVVLTADAMTRWLDEAEIPGSGAASDDLRQKVATFRPPAKVPGERRRGTVDMRQALQRLDAALPVDRVFATDAGRYVFETWPLIKVARPRSFVFTASYASIGLGMGQAIGASIAAPEKPTLLVCGDGGFMLGCLTEFATAVRARCDLVVIILNDGSYGAEHIQFRRKGRDPQLSLIDWPDFAPLAEALGGVGVTVRDEDALESAALATEHRDRSRPLLIDVKLDPDCIPLP
ncbi:thiamine pyrophosphate-binding protein [Terrarubrum flagellatum]|uniref:thiamine pyrophosphate-binding protein n=1 Tax=Terrirubrum flagellatum TaxID=2895980 RepID=UPI003144D5A2